MSIRPRIRDTLERLERWIREHQPAFLAAMRPGATDAELDDLERAIGRKLPEDVRAFYRWRAGVDSEEYFWEKSPFWNRPMTLEEIREMYTFCCDMAEHTWNTPERPVWWHPDWIPILAVGQDGPWYDCVDTAGLWTGNPGQIINFDNKMEQRAIHAPSLGSWLNVLVDDLERGERFDTEGNRIESHCDKYPFGYPDFRSVSTPPFVPPRPGNRPTSTPLLLGAGDRVRIVHSDVFSGFVGFEGEVVRLGPSSDVVVNVHIHTARLELNFPLESLELVERVGPEPTFSPHSEEWSTSANAHRLIDLLGVDTSPRKLWLFAAESWRIQNSEPRNLVDQLELVADGNLTIAEVQASLEKYWNEPETSRKRETIRPRTSWLRRVLYEYDIGVASLARPFKHNAGAIDLLREIFSNPFVPPRFESVWRTSTVAALARHIYDERTFDQLPILADALQDGGCDNEELLAHCRSDAPHVRGCWAVDLCLGLT